MRTVPVEYDDDRLNDEAEEYWRARHLPAGTDPARPAPPGTVTLEGPALPATGPLAPAVRAAQVAADIGLRYLLLTGRSVRELAFTLDAADAGHEAPDRLGIWFGRRFPRGLRDPAPGGDRSRPLTALAAQGLFVARDLPTRVCPRCGRNLTPERIAYRESLRPATVATFPLLGRDPPLSALVWTDAAWKLLATEAILLHPDRPYVRVAWRRRGTAQSVLVARHALPELVRWLPRGEASVEEERPGSQWAGGPYRHPLGEEMPLLADLPAPSGSLLASSAVKPWGTGIVALAPAHGPADGRVARELRLPARSVLAPNGDILEAPPSAYAGMPLATAGSCILRDLEESGALFARPLRAAGRPHCLECGTEVVWRSGRAWCLDLDRIPDAVRERFGRLLPGEPFPAPTAGLLWPVSGSEPSGDPAAPALAESPACGRVFDLPGPELCPCGLERPVAVRRALLPEFADALSEALQLGPLPVGGPLWLHLPERRRVPALLHRLLAWHATELRPPESRVVLVRGGTGTADPDPSSDADRAAIVRAALLPTDRRDLATAREEERDRLRHLWSDVGRFLDAATRAGVPPDPHPITAYRSELLLEDRALLSAFERMRRDALGLMDQGRWGAAYARSTRFYDRDFREDYLRAAAGRFDDRAGADARNALFHVLDHVYGRLCELWGPIHPRTTEAIHRAILGEGASLFEGRIAPVQLSLLDEAAETAVGPWLEPARTMRSARRRLGLGEDARVPQVVLAADSEEVAQRLAPEPELGARLLGAAKVVVASPREPWTGLEYSILADEEEVRKRFPAYHRKIVQLLTTMDPRRVREAVRADSLTVGLENTSIRIPPALVRVLERLPDRFASVPWSHGEILVEPPTPPGGDRPARLPPAAQRVLGHLERRLRRTGGDLPPGSEILLGTDPSGAAGLGPYLPRLGERLKGANVRIASAPEEFVARETSTGRMGPGRSFRARIPGRPAAPPRARRPEPPSRGTTVPRGAIERAPTREEADGRGADFAAFEADLSEVTADGPLGPAKVAAAWDAGFRSRAELAEADLDRLASLPGFGPWVAREFLARIAPARSVPDVVHGPAPRIAVGEAAPQATVVAPTTPPARTAPSPVPPVPDGAVPRTDAGFPVDASLGARTAGPPDPATPPAGVHLLLAPNRDEAWDRFLRALSPGAPGLWVGRLFPRALQSAGSDHDVRFLWLSTADRPNSIRPSDLPGLRAELERQLGPGGIRTVILEEIEYLAALHGVDAVRELVQAIDVLARFQNVAVWVPLDPGLLPGDPSVLARGLGPAP